MPPRIIGTELEYGALFYDEYGTECLLSNDVDDEVLNSATPEEYAGIGRFLRNGARFYMDIGPHPEYATPECLSIDEVVASELAGDRIVYDTMENVVRQLGNAGWARFALNRRVSGHDGDYWGYHENYSYPVKHDRYSMLSTLALHVATRNLYCGAGGVGEEGNFVIAQKAQTVTAAVDEGTTDLTKPLVSSRNEPLGNMFRWHRANVVGGDPNMSPWATRMKLGTTMLVMDMVEQGFNFAYLYEGLATHAMARQVASDLTMRKTVEYGRGSTMRPMDVQYELLGKAKLLSERVELGAEKLAVLEEWERALADLESGPEGLLDRADWPKRLQVMEAYVDRHKDGKFGPEKILRTAVDRMWDLLDPELGIGVKLRKGLWKRWMPEDELVERRLTEAPQDTRAALRGRFIQFARERCDQAVQRLDWQTVVIARHGEFDLSDPFLTRDFRLDDYMSTERWGWRRISRLAIEGGE